MASLVVQAYLRPLRAFVWYVLHTHTPTHTHPYVHCRFIYAYGMYINTNIVFCCCCETSRVSSSSLSVRGTSLSLLPCSLLCSLSCCLLPAACALANSLWRRKTAAWHLLRFSVVDFCYFNVLGFSFFLSFPLLSFALLCLALRRVHIFFLCLLPEL